MIKEVKLSKNPSWNAITVTMSLIEYSLRVASVAQELVILGLKIIYISLAAAARNILPKSKKDLKGEVVLITGSAHGVGRQLAIDTAKLGAKVVLWDINEGQTGRGLYTTPVSTTYASRPRIMCGCDGIWNTFDLLGRLQQSFGGHRKMYIHTKKSNWNYCSEKSVQEVAEEIKREGGEAWWYVCDVTSEKDIKFKAQIISKEVGDVTILVNNAGIMQNVPLLELDSEKIRRTFDVNVLAHFWTIRAFLPKMQEKNHGHIVAISSAAGLIGHVNQSDYSASKFAVVGMMEALSEEMRLTGCKVQFTTICPLTVNTGMNHHPVARYHFLTPILSIEEASRQILDAVRTDEFLVTLPKTASFALIFFKLLPRRVTCEVMDMLEYCRISNAVPTITEDKEK